MTQWNGEGALQMIMREMESAGLFVKWIMACVRIISYKYAVNENPTEVLKAKRGI